MAYARIVTHYVRHDAWLGHGRVFRDLGKLGDIPAVLINGRFDFQAPLAIAWTLHRQWPRSKLAIVNEAGHAASNSGITEQLIQATDHLVS